MGKRQSREELIKERRRELTQTLDEIERSVHTERLSHTDAFRRYVEIMTFYGYDHFTGISDTVSKMKSSWDKLMEDEEAITRIIGANEMMKLKKNRQRYFRLLLETRTIVKSLREQSIYKKQDVQTLQNFTTEALNNKIGSNEVTLRSEAQKEVFDHKLNNLLQWIEQSELKSITKKWIALCYRLEV